VDQDKVQDSAAGVAAVNRSCLVDMARAEALEFMEKKEPGWSWWSGTWSDT